VLLGSRKICFYSTSNLDLSDVSLNYFLPL